MFTSVFWNVPHKRLYERTGDPLGFDALREAMSDCLVPHITGATRHADDYIWILVGLRWARARASTTVDADVWEEFRKFERALKQYWHRFTSRRDYQGKREVAKLCEDLRPNVNKRILENERATGMLGSYISSLRAIGLVDASALSLTDHGDQLSRGLRFTARSQAFTSWLALNAAFKSTEIEIRECRKSLGSHLFQDTRMSFAAQAYLAHAKANSWGGLAAHLASDQRRVANACVAVLEAEKEMIGAFCELMAGQTRLSLSRRARLRNASALVRMRQPIPDAWLNRPIARALEVAWLALSNGAPAEQQLIDLHVNVVHSIRGNDAWITGLGEKSLVDYRPQFAGRDFRFKIMSHLLKETKWGRGGNRTG